MSASTGDATPEMSAKQVIEILNSMGLADIGVRLPKGWAGGKGITLDFETFVGLVMALKSGGTFTSRDSLGQDKVVEASAAGILTQATGVANNISYQLASLLRALPLSVGDNVLQPTSAQAAYAHHRIISVPFTLVGGVLANLELVPALASYKGRMRILAVWSDTAFAATLTFQDEDDAALVPPPCIETATIATAYTPISYNQPSLYWCDTANKALEVDISGGAGVEVGWILLEFWYEP